MTEINYEDVKKYFIGAITLDTLKESIGDDQGQAFSLLKDMYILSVKSKALEQFNLHYNELSADVKDEKLYYEVIEDFKKATTIGEIMLTLIKGDHDTLTEDFNMLATEHLCNTIEIIKNGKTLSPIGERFDINSVKLID